MLALAGPVQAVHIGPASRCLCCMHTHSWAWCVCTRGWHTGCRSAAVNVHTMHGPLCQPECVWGLLGGRAEGAAAGPPGRLPGITVLSNCSRQRCAVWGALGLAVALS